MAGAQEEVNQQKALLKVFKLMFFENLGGNIQGKCNT